jgi:hypothetical protein
MVCYSNQNEKIMKKILFYAGFILAVVFFIACTTSTEHRLSRRSSMTTPDTYCTIAPYFKVHPNKINEFRKLCERLVEKSSQEPQCLFYSYTFSGDMVHCREGYADAEAVLAHLENTGPLLNEALEIADIARLEVHGPGAELDKLRKPMEGLNPRFFTLEYGFRR